MSKYYCLNKVFFEGHSKDWFEAIYKLKTVCNPVNGKSHHMVEYHTWYDDGTGGTSKGTIRKLLDVSLGTYNGHENLGFIMTLAALKAQDREGPSEQGANLEGCFFGFVDDIDVGRDAAIKNSILNNLTGGNDITKQRKYKAESTFTPICTLVFMTNGIWQLESPPIGADQRRATGQQHTTYFVDKRHGDLGVGEVRKDSSVKENIKQCIPECLTLACMYFYIDQACSGTDVMQPRPPSADEFRRRFLKLACDPKAVMEGFIAACLTVWDKKATVALPSTTEEVQDAIVMYSKDNNDELQKSVVLEQLRSAKFEGAALERGQYQPPRGVGKRISVFKANGRILTLKPAQDGRRIL